MRYGVCTGFDNAETAAACGCDYFEPAVTDIAKMNNAEFDEAVQKTLASGLWAEVCNCFFDAETHMLVGATSSVAGIAEYTELALSRLARIGTKAVVLGSGKARNISPWFDRKKGETQFLGVLRLIGEIAKHFGITVALEPLPSFSTNLINTVEQGLEAVLTVNHPNVRLLADLFHVNDSGETYDAIERSGANLVHVHISKPVEGLFPAQNDGYDYASFITALKKSGYNNRLSIEAAAKDFPAELKSSIEFLKSCCK